MAALILGSSLFVVSYCKIPWSYLTIVWRHPSVGLNPEYRRVYVWSAAFVLGCMLSHMAEIITLFWGGHWYYVEALVRIVGGTISFYTAWWVVPTLLTILTRRETTMAALSKRLHEATGLGPELEAIARSLDQLETAQAQRKS